MANEAMGPLEADFLAAGHSHISMNKKLGNLTIITLGSVGQPRNGDNRVSCTVFDTETGKTEILRIEYDIDVVCAKIGDRIPHAKELIAILIAILRRGY